MSGSVSGANGAGQAETARQLDMIKAQAEAKAAQYHVVAQRLEAQLQRQEPAAPMPPVLPAADKPPPVPGPAIGDLRFQDDQQDPAHPATVWEGASSWLTSAVVHLAVILLLGVLTLNISIESPGTELTATIDAEEDVELHDVELGEMVDQTELDNLQALEVKLNDPGLAKLGETTNVTPADQLSYVGTIGVDDTVGEIGALFGRDGQGWASSGEGTGGATFFGVKAGGNRFAFVVDGSMSMRRNGWAACQRELVAAVGRLKPHQFFYVILFNAKPHRMFSDERPEPKPLRATPENVARLRKWVYSFKLQTGTLPMASMKRVLAMRPDAIYFLTDGRLHDDTEGYLKENNKRKDAYDAVVRAATVQTIGFYTEDGRAVLQRIAQDNGGTFRYVARPPGDVPPKRRKPNPNPNRRRQGNR